MYKGIILDTVQRDAFLSIAAQEGLIFEKGMTDGVFDSVTHHNPSLRFAQTIFEQFTVAGTVYVDPFIFNCLDGELIESGIIMPYKKGKDDVEGLFTFDIDIVQKMIAEKGLDIKYYTTDKIREIFDKWQEKVKEFLEIENQYNLDYNEVQIRRTLHLEPKIDYNGVDIDYFMELGKFIYHNPIFNVLKEYKEIFNIAYHNELLSPVINATNVSLTEHGKKNYVGDVTEAIHILRYTSEKLNRIYTACTLKENVKLIQSDEAKAYRSKIDEWLSSFSEQNYDRMQIVEKDIVDVQKAMKYQKYNEIVGKICATVGVVATSLPQVFPYIDSSPQVVESAAIISAIATYIGAITTFAKPSTQYLWASFGRY